MAKKTVQKYREQTADDLTLRLYPSNKDDRYYGTLSIATACEGFIAIKVNVYDGEKGAFVSFPSYKNKDGEYVDLVFPTSKELRDAVNELAEEVIKHF